LRSCGGLKSQDVEEIIFLRFWKNDPLQDNFQKSVPNGFITTPNDVLCSNFVKFGIGKIMHTVRARKSITVYRDAMQPTPAEA